MIRRLPGAVGTVWAACVTVTVLPATVSVPERCDVVVFIATVMSTLPSPEPLAPAVIVIQAAPLTAVQEQPVPDDTEIDDAFPFDGAVTAVGVTV